MPLPEIESVRVHEFLEEFCKERSGDAVKIEYHIKGNRVTLVESRPLFIDPTVWNSVNVVQFEFNSDLIRISRFGFCIGMIGKIGGSHILRAETVTNWKG